jgi:glycosyltransferase involved in cell wall biosynthesis
LFDQILLVIHNVTDGAKACLKRRPANKIMGKKAAIGILMNSLDMGGAEKQSLLQAKIMGSKYDVYYFVQKKKPQLKQHLEFIEKENINFIQLTGSLPFRVIQLISYIKKYRIRVIFAYLTLDNFLAGIVSIFRKVKCIGGVRSSSLPFLKFYVTLFLQKYVLDYMIFNNFFGRDIFVKRGFLPRKSIVIQNCINNIQANLNRQDKKIIKVLSVGRFIAQKDYLTALKAIQLSTNEITDKQIEYIIVGDGELYHQIENWIEELHLPNVNIVKNPDNIGDYYTDADIYLLSSTSEGMPNSIMEALNYSLPVVSTDVGDAGYLVKDGITGFLVPAKDYKLLSEKILELAFDNKLRTLLGTKGHNLLLEEFSEAKLREKYINFTELLLY